MISEDKVVPAAESRAHLERQRRELSQPGASPRDRWRGCRPGRVGAMLDDTHWRGCGAGRVGVDMGASHRGDAPCCDKTGPLALVQP